MAFLNPGRKWPGAKCTDHWYIWQDEHKLQLGIDARAWADPHGLGQPLMAWALNAHPVAVCFASADTEMWAGFVQCFVFLDLCLDITFVYETARVEREKGR